MRMVHSALHDEYALVAIRGQQTGHSWFRRQEQKTARKAQEKEQKAKEQEAKHSEKQAAFDAMSPEERAEHRAQVRLMLRCHAECRPSPSGEKCSRRSQKLPFIMTSAALSCATSEARRLCDGGQVRARLGERRQETADRKARLQKVPN